MPHDPRIPRSFSPPHDHYTDAPLSPVEALIKRVIGWGIMIIAIIVWCNACVDAI